MFETLLCLKKCTDAQKLVGQLLAGWLTGLADEYTSVTVVGSEVDLSDSPGLSIPFWVPLLGLEVKLLDVELEIAWPTWLLHGLQAWHSGK
ncbi:hypothetical protein ACROYT_G014089 [Oculina patagonica]